MKQNPDFVARNVGDELVLVPVTREAASLEGVFTLNGVGARIWELIETSETAEEVAKQLLTEYEVAEDEVMADVTELLDQLREIGAVID